MFAGIVAAVGVVCRSPVRNDGVTALEIQWPEHWPAPVVGASVAVNGVCLTATSVHGRQRRFTADLSRETLERTTAGTWTKGQPVNLEASLRLGDPIDGHIVQGHVDATAQVVFIRTPGGESVPVAGTTEDRNGTFEAPGAVRAFVVEKGSVALDGVSLTVTHVEDTARGVAFGVSLVPHTLQATTLSALRVGAYVNMETDMLARHVARLLEHRRS